LLHTRTVARSGQMGVTIATGLSDCRGHSPGEVSTRPRVSWQRQQHSADDMPMIATSRGVHMTTASSWRACLTMRCPHLITTSRYQQPDEARQLAVACARGPIRPMASTLSWSVGSEVGDATQRADPVVALRDGDPNAHDGATLVLRGQSDERLPICVASGACCSCSATGCSAAPLLLPANDASVVSAVTKRQGT
jgi:hypothetical protein